MLEKVANVVIRATGAPFNWMLRQRDSVLETFILYLIAFACVGYAATAFAQVQIAAARVWPAAGMVLGIVAAGVSVGAASGRYHYVIDVLLGLLVAAVAAVIT